MDDRLLMDFKTVVFANFGKFIDEIEGLKQLSVFRVKSPSLATFNNYSRNRGAASYQKKDNKHSKRQKLFCGLCFDNEKGKTTF